MAGSTSDTLLTTATCAWKVLLRSTSGSPCTKTSVTTPLSLSPARQSRALLARTSPLSAASSSAARLAAASAAAAAASSGVLAPAPVRLLTPISHRKSTPRTSFTSASAASHWHMGHRGLRAACDGSLRLTASASASSAAVRHHRSKHERWQRCRHALTLTTDNVPKPALPPAPPPWSSSTSARGQRHTAQSPLAGASSLAAVSCSTKPAATARHTPGGSAQSSSNATRRASASICAARAPSTPRAETTSALTSAPANAPSSATSPASPKRTLNRTSHRTHASSAPPAVCGPRPRSVAHSSPLRAPACASAASSDSKQERSTSTSSAHSSAHGLKLIWRDLRREGAPERGAQRRRCAHAEMASCAPWMRERQSEALAGLRGCDANSRSGCGIGRRAARARVPGGQVVRRRVRNVWPQQRGTSDHQSTLLVVV